MNILFVCTGNTCRSPMAEAILKTQQLDGVEVQSAGLFAGGGPISGHAQNVLATEGIDMDHQSRSITPKDIDWATLVLTMTKAHKDALIRSYPGAGHKIYTLKEYVYGDEDDVSDPYGGPKSLYRETYQELQGLLAGLKQRLDNQ